MRNSITWVSLVLATLLIPATVSAVPQGDGYGPFVDTDGSIHEADVAALWAAGLTVGCAPWRYCPEEPVTRGQMAAFLNRALELDNAGPAPFVDIDASPFFGDISAIAAADITRGCSVERFCPEAAVTRAQLATFLVRALGLPPAERDWFSDDDGDVHESDINALASAGLTRGCGTDRFCPHRPVTRQEMASFLARAFSLAPPAVMPEIPGEVIADYLEELSRPAWPTGPGAEGWRPLVEIHFRPGDVDRAIRIIACESNGDPWARNPRSGASGLFQHMPRYWEERSRAAGFGGASIFDPEANVGVAAWLVYDYAGGGWQHWVCRG